MPRSLLHRYFLVMSLLAFGATVPVAGLYFYLTRGERDVLAQNAALVAEVLPDERYPKRVLRPAQHWLGTPRLSLWILEDSGKLVRSSDGSLPPAEWTAAARPGKPLDFETHGARDSSRGVVVVRLPGPERRLLVAMKRPKPPLRWLGLPMEPLLLVASLLSLHVLLSALTLFTYLRRKGRLAEQVLRRLQAGDLGARFPIGSGDELGQLMARFNLMAAEIERLVRSLEASEQSRTRMLEELAHDLRTPLTGIWSLFQTIAERADLPPERYRKHIEGALPEIDYLNRLIEDLFLLARMREPKYQPSLASLDLRELVARESEASRHSFGSAPQAPALTVEPGSTEAWIEGDAHLLRRLLRNLLANGARFARTTVHIATSTNDDGSVSLLVRDDGPGIDESKLTGFGELRPQVGPGAATSASLGLGSVIMKSIVEQHRGKLRASNWRDAAGRVGGAQVEVRFPAAKSAQRAA